MHLKMSSAIWQQICLGLNVLKNVTKGIHVVTTPVAPFTNNGLTLIPAWISNHTPNKVWDEITYPFLNFNGCTVEV